MDDSEVDRHRQELQAFCSNHVVKPEELPRVTTCITITCTDHALNCGAKLGLLSFVNPHPSKPLEKHEERYYVMAVDLPDECCSEGQLRRVGIRDTRNISPPRFELIRPEAGVRHRLHARSDRGNVGWTQWFPIYSIMNVMGSFWYDECHKFWDDDKNA